MNRTPNKGGYNTQSGNCRKVNNLTQKAFHWLSRSKTKCRGKFKRKYFKRDPDTPTERAEPETSGETAFERLRATMLVMLSEDSAVAAHIWAVSEMITESAIKEDTELLPPDRKRDYQVFFCIGAVWAASNNITINNP